MATIAFDPAAPARFTSSGRLVPGEPAPEVASLPAPVAPLVRRSYRVRAQPDGSALLIGPDGAVISPFASVELANRTLRFLTP